jgi:hypothetical protein
MKIREAGYGTFRRSLPRLKLGLRAERGEIRLEASWLLGDEMPAAGCDCDWEVKGDRSLIVSMTGMGYTPTSPEGASIPGL